MRGLIVEDEPLIVGRVRRLLPMFELDCVATPAEASAVFEARDYAFVLADICFGAENEQSGLGLVRALRARLWFGPVVVMSAIVDEDLERLAREVGADGWLHKLDLPRLRVIADAAVRAAACRGAGSAAPLRATLDTLPADLRSLASAAIDASAAEQASHAEYGFRVVLLAGAAVESERSWGVARAVESCALVLGVSLETMRQRALVASKWNTLELRHLLLERRNASGEHISVSHLYELAHLPRSARLGWLERVFAESLTVQALREALRARPTVLS